MQLVNLTVGFGRGPGIDASGVDNVLVLNCTVYGLGTSGVDLSGTNSGETTPFSTRKRDRCQDMLGTCVRKRDAN
eukprot:COSAG06_NODE_29791_length_550_cov_0.993348_1_plen_75_part_00